MSRGEIHDRPHAVYRVYDADDQLLYVGCTATALNRVASHGVSEWWRHALYMTFEHHPNRASARDAETAAIDAEDPIYNLRRSNWSAQQANNIKAQARRRIEEYASERQATS